MLQTILSRRAKRAFRPSLCAVVVLTTLLVPASAFAQTQFGPIVPPKPKADPGVKYPDRALKERFFEDTTVIVVIEIDANGVVRKAAVEAPQGHGFDEAAIAAAEKLVFDPATRDGVPIAARFRFRYVFRAPPARLVGRIADRATDAPLSGADVKVRAADGEHAIKTVPDGTWSLGDASRGPVHVTAVARDHDAESADAELTPGEETSIVLRLAKSRSIEPAPTMPGQRPLEAVVKGTLPPRAVTTRTLERESILLIPGTNGDALRSLQSLPGIARPPPFNGQLGVRGSAPLDTNIFIDGTPIPLVYHFGGLSSVMPTELLDKIDFFPGNYGAMYGRGMGGVVDVAVRRAKDDGLHGMAQIDAIDARVLAEGEIASTGIRFIVAARRSWFDLWLGPVLKATGSGVTTAPRYYDYQALLERDFGSRQSLRVFFFGSDDSIDILNPAPGSSASGLFLNQVPGGSSPTLGGSLSSHTSFWRVQGRYQIKFSDATRLSVVAAVGQDSIDLAVGSRVSNSTHEIPITGRAELSQKVFDRVSANVGVDLAYVPYHLDVRRPSPLRPGVPNGGPLDVTLESIESGARFLPGMYTEWEITPFQGTRIVPGIRLDYASATKSWDVSPRINVRQDIHRGFPRTTLKGGVGLYYQPPQPLEADPVFGQKGLVSNRSIQSDVGVEQELTRPIDLSVDVFYKSMGDLVTPGAKNAGAGDAYGVEWFLRYKADDRFFGWLSYTFSRSERRDILADPVTVFSSDQTHVFTVLGSYDIGWGIRVGARFRLVSGNPYTPSNQGAYDASTGTFQAAPLFPPNGARLPLFHALDLRIDRTWSFRLWKLTAYVDVQNVYDRQSPEGVGYNFNYTQSSLVNGLPILPSIGVRGEL